MVTDAVQAKLTALGAHTTVLGETAVQLASRLDDPDTPATAVATIARELRELISRLDDAAPAQQGRLDELTLKREQRRQAAAT